LIVRQLSLLLAALMVWLGGCAGRNAPSLGATAEAAPEIAPDLSSAASLNVKREPWQFGEHTGCLICTPNHRIYTTIESERILERLPLFYERALEHYTTEITKLPKPPSPLETFLFQTRTQWQAKTEQMLPDQARMFSNLGRGGFTTRGTAVLYYIDRGRRDFTRDTFAIAAHEGWHQYTQRTFKHQLPIWLEEGVATYMEGYRIDREGFSEFVPTENRERAYALRDAVRNRRLIPLDDLLTRTPQSFLNNSKDSLLTYYSQVWALTRFLVEGEDGRYRQSLATVLTDAAEGRLVGRMMTSTVTAGSRRMGGGVNRVGPAVVQEYFNRDVGEFEKQYLAFIDQLVQMR
jgi:hypothetical protein